MIKIYFKLLVRKLKKKLFEPYEIFGIKVLIFKKPQKSNLTVHYKIIINIENTVYKKL